MKKYSFELPDLEIIKNLYAILKKNGIQIPYNLVILIADTVFQFGFCYFHHILKSKNIPFSINELNIPYDATMRPS